MAGDCRNREAHNFVSFAIAEFACVARARSERRTGISVRLNVSRYDKTLRCRSASSLAQLTEGTLVRGEEHEQGEHNGKTQQIVII